MKQKPIEIPVDNYGEFIRLQEVLAVYGYSVSQDSVRAVEKMVSNNDRGQIRAHICARRNDKRLKCILRLFRRIENI